MRRIISLAAAAMLASASPALAATQVTDGSGHLTGATGVTVGSSTYDVSFVDGTCSGLFGGCDSASDFAFQTQADGQAAADALLAQVLTGSFDTDYTLTSGCATNGSALCALFVPYATDGTNFSAVAAVNSNTVADGTALVSGPVTSLDTTSLTAFVFARFTPAAGAVPEPATWAMMLMGFGAIGAAMRRQRNSKRRRSGLASRGWRSATSN